ncbi:MAG: hypothetical protein ACI92E_000994, partial [Oceanicoccus sp.]
KCNTHASIKQQKNWQENYPLETIDYKICLKLSIKNRRSKNMDLRFNRVV